MIAVRRVRSVRPRVLRASLGLLAVAATSVGLPFLTGPVALGPVAPIAASVTPIAGTPSGPSGLTPGTAAPSALQPPAGVVGGNDVSWTQCSVSQGGLGNPMPGPDAHFAIVQLSLGQAFTSNPCLTDEVSSLYSQRLPVAAYVVMTYPTNVQFARYGSRGPYGTRTFAARLANVGWQEAAYWVAVHTASGMHSPMVWVDVETTLHGPQWSSRTAYNLAVIRGLLAGLARSGLRTGIYTTSAHWRDVTGGVRLGQPEWRTVGQDTPAVAVSVCSRPGNQGSLVVLAQYTSSASVSVDYDLLCPATAATALARYFTRP